MGQYNPQVMIKNNVLYGYLYGALLKIILYDITSHKLYHTLFLESKVTIRKMLAFYDLYKFSTASHKYEA